MGLRKHIKVSGHHHLYIKVTQKFRKKNIFLTGLMLSQRGTGNPALDQSNKQIKSIKILMRQSDITEDI